MTSQKCNSTPKIGGIHRFIRGTEYIVTGAYASAAKETGSKKIEKLILQDFRKSSMLSLAVLQMAAQKKGVQHD